MASVRTPDAPEDAGDTHVFKFRLIRARPRHMTAEVKARLSDTISCMKELLWQQYRIPKTAVWTFSVPCEGGGWKACATPEDRELLRTIWHVRQPICIFRQAESVFPEDLSDRRRHTASSSESAVCGTEILEEEVEDLPLTFVLTEADFADAPPPPHDDAPPAASEEEEEDGPEKGSSEQSEESDRVFLDAIAAAGGPMTFNEDEIEVVGLTFTKQPSDESDNEDDSSSWSSGEFPDPLGDDHVFAPTVRPPRAPDWDDLPTFRVPTTPSDDLMLSDDEAGYNGFAPDTDDDEEDASG
jgi:hypothetical protein